MHTLYRRQPLRVQTHYHQTALLNYQTRMFFGKKENKESDKAKEKETPEE
jgi:hypothetical protein